MPDYPVSLSQPAAEKLFGRFSWRGNGQSCITILGRWIEENITTVYIRELDGAASFGGTFNGRVRWHRSGVEQILRAWAEVGQMGLGNDVVLWGGSFVPRRMRGSKSLSRHSWGIAFDINPAENAFRKHPMPLGAYGSVMRLVPVFEKHGFAWGGRWSPNTDGMHFELARLIDYSQKDDTPDAQLVINNEWQKAIPLKLKDGTSHASLALLAKAVGDTEVPEDRLVPVAQYLGSRGYHVTWNASRRKVLRHGRLTGTDGWRKVGAKRDQDAMMEYVRFCW